MHDSYVTISCSAGYGVGGLGAHLAELVEAARGAGTLHRYFTTRPRCDDDAAAEAISTPLVPLICRYSPIRFSPGRKQHLTFDAFDRAVARRLCPGHRFIGFADQSLQSFYRARRLGYRLLELVSPTAHIEHVARQHRRAFEDFPIEPDWLNEAHRQKTLEEYNTTDTIHVASEYTRQSFLNAGFAAERLVKVASTVDARFAPPTLARQALDNDVFRVVYTGALSVVKGVPLLIEAFCRLNLPSSQLILVGYSGTRGMRRYLQRSMRADSRIQIEGGDPLPHLHRASVYVQPSYQDGFGRAPMEAIACGVPVIVTDNTGMKELVREGENGFVIPTGDASALSDRLTAVHSGFLRRKSFGGLISC